MAQVDLAASVLRPQIVEEMDQGVTLKNEMKDGKMDTYGKLKIVPLTPYAHQVSGHSFIMSFDEYTLCKPLHEREHRFYEGLPAQLKAFTPAYKGIAKVFCKEDESNQVQLFALLPVIAPGAGPSVCQTTSDNTDLLSEEAPKQDISLFTGCCIHRSCVDKSCSISGEEHNENGDEDSHICFQTIPNQWQSRVQHRLRKSFKLAGNNFILLEDIAAKFCHPCVLDLKMGTRQYADDADEDKIVRHTKRCETSTSTALGCRLAGMRIYHKTKDCYSFVDKYIGRHLDRKEFKNAVWEFFRNGINIQPNLIDSTIKKLNGLLHQIELTDCYRFYSSSLLIMYEADNRTDSDKSPCLDIRMIDFARISLKGDENNFHVGPDRGFMLGLQTIIDFLEELKHELMKSNGEL